MNGRVGDVLSDSYAASHLKLVVYSDAQCDCGGKGFFSRRSCFVMV